MKRSKLSFVITTIIAVFLVLPAFVEASETTGLRPGECKCDWSARGFSGTIWVTIKSVENGAVKGEIQVTGSGAISYEKFTSGKFEDNTLTIPLRRFLFLLTIENGQIVRGESRDLLNSVFNTEFSCWGKR